MSNNFVKYFCVLFVLIFCNSAKSEYYWYEFQGSSTWPSPSASQSCQSFFDSKKSYYSAPSDVISGCGLTSGSWGAPGDSFHCKCNLTRPGGDYVIKGQVNIRGDECPSGHIFNASLGMCEEGAEDECSNPNKGNPVNILTGKKNQSFIDMRLGDIEISRRYKQNYVGAFWTFNLLERLDRLPFNGVDNFIYKHQGREDYLSKQGDVCWRSSGSACYTLTETGTEVTLGNSAGSRIFDLDGRLIKVLKQGAANPIIYNYEAEKVVVTQGQYSVTLTMNGDEGITQATSTDLTINYEYNADGMLEKVVWPGGDIDFYRYSQKNPEYLISMGTNDLIYAEWEYDTNWQVEYSQHSGEADRTLFSYSADVTTVTNSLKKNTLYHFQDVAGVKRLVRVEGEPTSRCAGANKIRTYYPAGNMSQGLLKTKTDWQDVVTYFEYNERGLEILKVQAQGTPDEKSTITDWHPTLNLPASVTTSTSKTSYSYDANGRLLNKTTENI